MLFQVGISALPICVYGIGVGWGGVCTYVCANVTRQRSITRSCLLSLALHILFVETRSHCGPGALRLASECQRSDSLRPSPLWVTDMGCHAHLIMRVLKIWTQVLPALTISLPCIASFYQECILSVWSPSISGQLSMSIIHYLAHRPPSPRGLTIGLACSQWESCEASLGGTLLPPEPDLASLFSLAIRTSSWMCLSHPAPPLSPQS